MAKRKQQDAQGVEIIETTVFPPGACSGFEVKIGQVLPEDGGDTLATIAELTHRNVMADEYDADPGEAPSAATASERTRDYHQGVREGILRMIEFVESDFGDVGRVAAGEARKRWAL
jgi:hypothetical protein